VLLQSTVWKIAVVVWKRGVCGDWQGWVSPKEQTASGKHLELSVGERETALVGKLQLPVVPRGTNRGY